MAFFPVLRAQRMARLSGCIVGAQKSAGVSRPRVQILELNKAAVVDRDGCFVLSDLPYGKYTLLLSRDGVAEKRLSITLDSPEQHLGALRPSHVDARLEAGYTVLSDAALSSDETENQVVPPLLQASRDAFLRTAAYHLRSYWFALRGYDSRFSDVLLNGITVNDAFDGRPSWHDWSGLNDITRHPQEIKYGLQPSDYSFSGVGNSTAIDTRAAAYPQQLRLSVSVSNRTYRQRLMATYTSGLMKSGWAFIFSASRRWAQEGVIAGTSYDAWSCFAGLERRFTAHHSVSLSAMFAPARWASRSPNTREVYALRGKHYNAYWGWQDDKRRSERMRSSAQPILQWTDYWNPSEDFRWTNTFSHRFGYRGETRLQTYGAPNPSPTYYRHMPSYFLSLGKPCAAGIAREHFSRDLHYAQLDWPAFYRRNHRNRQTIVDLDGQPGTSYTGRQAAYYLAEDRRTLKDYDWNSRISYRIDQALSLHAGFAACYAQSENYRRATDLLGADFILDKNPYATTSQQADNNLRTPNHLVFKHGRLAYDYTISRLQAKAFARLNATLAHWDLFLGTTAAHTAMQRSGKYQNGRHPDRSLGPGKAIYFTDYGLKSGMTLKVNGRHYVTASSLYQTLAPTATQAFADARSDGLTTPHLQATRIYGANLSYDYRTPLLKAKASLYYTRFENLVHIQRGYLEGLVLANAAASGKGMDDFVTTVMPDVATRHMGVEVGLDAKLSAVLSASFAASVGQYTYANTPELYWISDTSKTFQRLGKAYLKNYKLGGTPQQAYTLGLSYNSPHYWWVGIFGNYLASHYLRIAPALRTRAFLTNPLTHLPYRDLTDTALRALLKQERLPDAFMLDFNVGSTWRFHGCYMGVTLAVHNALDDQRYATAGFESARKANYRARKAAQLQKYPVFGSEYWYDLGTTFFLNLFVRL